MLAVTGSEILSPATAHRESLADSSAPHAVRCVATGKVHRHDKDRRRNARRSCESIGRSLLKDLCIMCAIADMPRPAATPGSACLIPGRRFWWRNNPAT